MEQKLYWFCFSYVDNARIYASTYTGYSDKSVTLKHIKENKTYAGVSDNAVLLSLSYLGYMTRMEFTGG